MHETHDDLRGIDLNLVVALDALLVERHVTRAAQRLGITQPAASHALARLRDLFRDPLLVRGPGGTMIATPRAVELAPLAHDALVHVAAVLHAPAFDPATAKHTFRIGTSDYVELVVLPELMARITRLAPDIDIWIHTFTGHGDDELAAGTLDLVLSPPRGKLRRAATFEKVLFDETFTLLVRKKHPYAGPRMTLARYCALPHLLVAPRGTAGGTVDDALAELGKSRRVALAVPHFLVVPHVIARSDLVTTLPTRIAALFADTLDVVTMAPPIAIPKFHVAAAWHERSHRDLAHRWLREQLFAVAAEL